MTDTQQRAAAKKFADFWKGKGYEKGQSQPFWLSLLRDVYGVEYPEQFAEFESRAHIDHRGFIDIIIPSTRVLIEQKSLDIDLRKPIKQSDGTLLTPFQQAKRYITELPLSKHPRWVVTCNFSTFLVYDMERPGGEPEEILLENLPAEFYRLAFLIDSGNERLKREMEVSVAAGEIVGLLYDAFSKQYVDLTTERALKSLNVLCVRLVFCLYADDADIFGRKAMFHDYLAEFEARHMRKALIELFDVLDTLPENRDPYLDENLAKFPYVNGGLFDEKDVEIPHFTDEIRTLLLTKASENFNWVEISPTIFGAVFESTLNPDTRRSGGMHYTSLENIHKVIDPLFFDELKKEFEQICTIAVEKTKMAKLREFQSKIAKLSFLDPACGSGNFLTETYISLRRLENELLSIKQKGQIQIGDANYNPIQVSIGQFYGIEVNDFAVTVARTALWIAENQMMKETESIIHMQLDYLPLKTYANIIEGNTLRVDWESVVPKHKLSYIMGNPPFVGYSNQSIEQKAEMLAIYVDEKGNPFKTAGKIDYVAAWYYKAAEYMRETQIRTAFVSTNSITQGEQVAAVWKPLFDMFGITIDFAHRTFKWSSEANEKAAVHCVIVGFSIGHKGERVIYDGEIRTVAKNISPYLIDSKTIFIEGRRKPLCDAPEMIAGGKPTDGGFLILNEKERNELVCEEPQAEKYIRRYYMGNDFINDIKRYCLWLVDCPPHELLKMPKVRVRVESVRQARLNSPKAATRAKAETPMLFDEIRNITGDNYIAVPKVSSERRRYIPIGYLPIDNIPGDKLFVISDIDLYGFGILTSNVHMAWMRTVCGRLKSDYSYSNTIVYNNFPWPDATDKQKAEIERLAQNVLTAREKYPDSTLANMYGETSMLYHTDLLNAHRELDRAVMKLYGFPVKDFSEADCVAALMDMYQKLIEEGNR
ncbi:MAG: N-6 DNA methylase [Defluviitaleaceae bacterium]|nr:N-6 DNA methylase [Defluviitaleaceae bacterium]